MALVAALAASSLVRSASAQQESATPAMPQPEAPSGPVEVSVHGERRSPEFTQGRSFGATRFWLLDPGQQEAEAWYSARFRHNGDPNDTEHLWQFEYMIGVLPHVQLDTYFNYAWDKENGYHIEGAQIEGRFAIGRHYGDIWGNPALYLEWHPQTNGPNRGEIRILLGGQIFSPRFYGALNPYLEQNLDAGLQSDGKKAFISDREVGASAALGYAVVPGRLSIGAEVKAGADQQGLTGLSPSTYKAVALLGPALWLNLLKGHLRFTYTGLFGLTNRSDAYYPIFVVSVHP
jgi:hypothetical protein